MAEIKAPTTTEENYLKAIYKHSKYQTPVSTNTLSAELNTTPASVTDMIKKLNDKELLNYTPYKGVSLTSLGAKLALGIIRKHRLWEVFLVEKLNFSWDEVHDTAEQLEHIRSPKLIAALDEYLGFPHFDPHGDPIPDDQGKILQRKTIPLSELQVGKDAYVAAVLMHTTEFLRYLNRLELNISSKVRVREQISFDDSRLIEVEGKEVIVSSAVTQNVLVTEESPEQLRSGKKNFKPASITDI